MRSFKELKVWEKGHNLTLDIYRSTRDFPDSERFGLVSQMRRAATSIPTNIAEGCGRKSDRELARFMTIAAGSASELEYQCLLARDLGYLEPDIWEMLNELIIETRKMLYAFIRRIENPQPNYAEC